jgi:hypothetical protein
LVTAGHAGSSPSPEVRNASGSTLVVVALQEGPPPQPAPPERRPGGWKGRVEIADDFDAPLPEDVENAFYDSQLEPPR